MLIGGKLGVEYVVGFDRLSSLCSSSASSRRAIVDPNTLDTHLLFCQFVERSVSISNHKPVAFGFLQIL
jgi:hypothetical protein